MATTPQPAKKSYFFDKGYKDLGNTIKGAWARNSDSIKKYASNLGNLGDHGLPVKLFLGLVNILAMVAVVVCGSAITAVITFINIVILLVFMAILCIPNGIPIMVMHQIKPIQNEIIAISHPHNIIQRILTKKCLTLLLYSTQRPNGYKTNPANFKHCIPSGMPIKVIKQSNAAINHSSEIIPPPNRNHIMLPKIFILLPQT